MTGATVALRPITPDDELLVDRLWQLYSHDLSQSRGSLPNGEGLFKQGHLAHYRDNPDDCVGFVVEYDGAPAGFAYVTRLNGEFRSIGDFFVVRALRRRRVGFDVATELIRRFPGRWEIAFQAENAGAPEFWRRVATSLVGNAWTEELRPVPDKPQIPPDHWLVFELTSGQV